MPDTKVSSNSTTPTDRRRQLMFIFIVVAIAARLIFWVMTDRVWEDALITLRHAENAARGVGMTHHPDHGDPVHGFTSPMSVLIPFVAEWMRPGSGMIVLRLSSLIATVLSIYLGYRICVHRSIGISNLATFFFLGFIAVEFHQILFSMGGMETQWIVAITLLVLLCFLEQNAIGLGLACAATLWGRPDGVVMVAAVVLALVIRMQWRKIPVVVLVAGACFAPWIVFCEIYYGSFVPHTIIAKKVAYVRTFSEAEGWGTYTQLWASELLRRMNFLRLWLSPLYGGTGSAINFIRGARPLQFVYFIFVCVGVVHCLRRKEMVLFAVYTVAFASYMLIMLAQPAWWYVLPWLNIVALMFVIGIDRFRLSRPSKAWRMMWAMLPCIYLGLYAFANTRTFPAERHIQRGIEDACRVKIGQWLAQNAGEHDWIGCECLGYIGSYSNRPILDFPGLSCPRTVRANLQNPEGNRSMVAMFAREKPEWLVMRPNELADFVEQFPDAAGDYTERKRFFADPGHVLAMGRWIWADGYQLTIDEEFAVLEKNKVTQAISELP